MCLQFFSAENAHAVSKCVVDGKTIYQHGPCPLGTEKSFSGYGFFSTMTSKDNEKDTDAEQLRQLSSNVSEDQLEKQVKNVQLK